MKQNIIIDGNQLSIESLIRVAFEQAGAEISPQSYKKIEKSRKYIEKQVSSKKIIYGVTTGFGANASKVIDDYETAKELQRNLLVSHACGVGEPFGKEVVRAIMLIRLNTLLAGYSGVRIETVNLLCAMLNHNIHPLIPSQGSVGASGDLCPLAHMALVLIGEGFAEVNGKILSGKEALSIYHLQGISLEHKEGIALLNGTSVMAALGAIGVYQSKELLQKSLKASCLMFEAIGARTEAFDARLHKVRKHVHQEQIASLVRDFTKNSTLMGIKTQEIGKLLLKKIQTRIPPKEQKKLISLLENHPHNVGVLGKYMPNDDEKGVSWQKLSALLRLAEKKVSPQDAYSVRCSPQVLGASLQAISHAEEIIAAELNAVVDNPLIFADDDAVISGGNFHGQPLALALDYLKLAIAEIGNILERQIYKLTDEATNDCLPAFLAADTSGLHSGLMIPQYVAASLVSENKVLVHPASADSIPTCANQEDHVSMGSIAGRQALQMIANVKHITVILMLTAHQGVHLRRRQLEQIDYKVKLGKETQKLFRKLDKLVGFIEKDRFFHQDIQLILKNWSHL